MKTYSSPGLKSACFAEGDGELPVEIRLPEGANYGMTEETFLFPDNAKSVHVRLRTDATAGLRGKVGCTAAFFDEEGKVFVEDYLEVLEENGHLVLDGQWEREEHFHGFHLRCFFKWTVGACHFSRPVLTWGGSLPKRMARIVTTRMWYVPGEDMAARKERMKRLLDKIGNEVSSPDIILFTEEAPSIGMGIPNSTAWETIPGPTTEWLADYARQLNTHIACGILQNEGGQYRNACVILDRKGSIAGIYHKVHLTTCESRNGVVPGETFPVFDLDFDKVSIAICWDNWFCESARSLRLNGAEIMLVPIAGDGIVTHRDHVWPARAVEQGMAVAFSVFSNSEDGKGWSCVFDAMGNMLAKALAGTDYCFADVDLGKRYRTRFLSIGNGFGEGRTLYVHERRNGVYADIQR
ncbi:MAG: carbon-nitrogen hydrolase family protein [Victivallales bacterium]|nr:carbon-nitrogen hydrolase family protein [Victivallales bacterium]